MSVVPLQICLALLLLWNQLGLAVLSGVLLMALLFPANFLITQQTRKYQVG
jgi:hypothetical protein